MNKIKSIIRLRSDNEIEIDIKYFAKDNSIVDTYIDLDELLDYINELEESRDKALDIIEQKRGEYDIPDELENVLKGSDKE